MLWNGTDFDGLTFFVEEEGTDMGAVWMIREGVIHCTGIPNGYMRTEKDYADYKLHVEWRWAEEPGNSGVLIHMKAPDKIWPLCVEGQLKSGNAGDFYLMGGSEINEQEDKTKRLIPKKEESSEKPGGEWNAYNITCNGSSIELVVNGVVQNTATGASVQSGKIGFQSEGKPIQFRNIYLDPIQ